MRKQKLAIFIKKKFVFEKHYSESYMMAEKTDFSDEILLQDFKFEIKGSSKVLNEIRLLNRTAYQSYI